MDLLIYLIIWIGKAIMKAHRQRQEKKAAIAEAGGDIRASRPKTSGKKTTTKTRAADPAAAGAMARAIGRLVSLSTAAEAHDAALAETAERFRRLGSRGRVFVEIIDRTLRPQLDDAADEARRATERVKGQAPVDALHTLRADPVLADALSTLSLAEPRANLLSAMADWREDARLGGMLADADALAADLYEPIRQLADTYQLGVPNQRPVTAPGTGDESLWLGLLPEGTPLIVVPDDFDEDLYRHASVPHEIGHLVWERVPGLASEVAGHLGLTTPAALLRFQDGRVMGTLEQPFSAWLVEMFCDAFGVLLLGPSALRGFVHSFQNADDPDATLTAHVHDGRYAPHPPAWLRVRMAGHVLRRMGFDVEAKAIEAEWDALHGEAGGIVLPCEGGVAVRVGTQLLLDFATPRLDALYDTEWASLSGFRLSTVPDLEMTAARWTRGRSRAQQLASAEPFHDAGRIVLAAAIEARTQQPARHDRIAAGLRRAILGRDANERRAADPRYQRRKAGAVQHRLADEVRDALILREVLGPPAFKRRGRPGIRQ